MVFIFALGQLLQHLLLSDLSGELRGKSRQSVGTQMHSDFNILAFTFQFVLVASSGLEIRTFHLHPQKKQMKINMCETFKVTAKLNFDPLASFTY